MPSEPSAEEREATVNRLREQLANCQTIAASKTGSDRDGWLDDAKHYETALRIIQSAERDTANRSASASLWISRKTKSRP
jgi:hypothetical protein